MATLVDCPKSNLGEWRFGLLGVPVGVKWWFWAACLLTSYVTQATTGGILIWIAVCFGSILLHEMGHVLALRTAGAGADVVLYGWGGLTIPERPVRSPVRGVLIALAGSAASLCAAGLVIAAAAASGMHILFAWRMLIPEISVIPASGILQPDNLIRLLLNALVQVNFYWGLANLLPVYPLDGAHAVRAVFECTDPYNGRRRSFILSIATASGIVLVGVLDQAAYLAIVFAVLAIASFQGLDEGK